MHDNDDVVCQAKNSVNTLRRAADSCRSFVSLAYFLCAAATAEAAASQELFVLPESVIVVACTTIVYANVCRPHMLATCVIKYLLSHIWNKMRVERSTYNLGECRALSTVWRIMTAMYESMRMGTLSVAMIEH